jgi:AhpD family alkylhydroperoxidase
MPKKSTPSASIFTPAVAELVAIGAAIGSNCEPCFKYHYNLARKLGVSKEDIAQAVEMADCVKRVPAQSILELADKTLGTTLSEGTGGAGSSCCCEVKPAKSKKKS